MVTNEETVSQHILTNGSAGTCLEEVSHAPAVLPAFLRDPAVSLDDDVDDLLLTGCDVHNLDLAVLEAEDEVAAIDIPARDPCTLAVFLNLN